MLAVQRRVSPVDAHLQLRPARHFETADGPRRILAKMDETEMEFLNDLFEAKLKYVTTRPYWNKPLAKPHLY